VDVPVLITAFNRPDRLAGLLERLQQVQPTRLYVAVDGPRQGVPGDAEAVHATRSLLAQISWNCDLRTRFHEGNLGCGRAVASAIDWLFEHEDAGIVLEDDVLPEVAFFGFCGELLERYAQDPRVWAVSGCNFVPPEHIGTSASYRFTSVPHIWGWATWRRSWSLYRYDIQGWRTRQILRAVWDSAPSALAFAYWCVMFELAARRVVDTWDYQAVLAALASGSVTATSNVNLVTNVGFGAEATHTARAPKYLRAPGELHPPLRHPDEVAADARSDRWTQRNVFGLSQLDVLEGLQRIRRQRSGS
jgi:hypothetical protein